MGGGGHNINNKHTKLLNISSCVQIISVHDVQCILHSLCHDVNAVICINSLILFQQNILQKTRTSISKAFAFSFFQPDISLDAETDGSPNLTKQTRLGNIKTDGKFYTRITYRYSGTIFSTIFYALSVFTFSIFQQR